MTVNDDGLTEYPGTVPLDETFWNGLLGQPGTPERTAWDASYAVYKRRMDRIGVATGWLRHIPIVGGVAWCFWATLLEEGPRGLKPRWGGLTFGYLNDGFKPTVWHTWQTMLKYDGRYSGIWMDGAPRSKTDADERLGALRSRPDPTE